MDITVAFCIMELLWVPNYTFHKQFWISLSNEFQLKLKVLIFQTKFAKKGYFQSKREKLNITTEFCIFCLDWQFWLFGQNLPKQGYSILKQKMWTPKILELVPFEIRKPNSLTELKRKIKHCNHIDYPSKLCKVHLH